MFKIYDMTFVYCADVVARVRCALRTRRSRQLVARYAKIGRVDCCYLYQTNPERCQEKRCFPEAPLCS